MGRQLLLCLEFLWELLNNFVAVCFSVKIPTEKLKKPNKIRSIKLKQGAQISLVFDNFSAQNFVRELLKNSQRISKPSGYSRIQIRILSEFMQKFQSENQLASPKYYFRCGEQENEKSELNKFVKLGRYQQKSPRNFLLEFSLLTARILQTASLILQKLRQEFQSENQLALPNINFDVVSKKMKKVN